MSSLPLFRPSTSRRVLDRLRMQILRVALATTGILAPAVAAAVMLSGGLVGPVRLEVLLLATTTLAFPLLWLVARHLEVRTTGALYVGLVQSTAFCIMLRGGVGAAPTGLVLLATMLSGLFFGVRGLLASLGFTIGSLAIACGLVLSGYVPPLLASLWNRELTLLWFRSSAMLLVLATGTGGIVHYAIRELDREAQTLRNALQREAQQRLELERLSQENERAREELEDARRAEAIGQLASGIAHDLNNFLTIVMSALEVAETTPGLPEEGARCLGDAMSATRQSAGLVRNLLAVGKKDVVLPRRVDVESALEKLATHTRRLLEQDVELVIDVRQPGSVYCDPDSLDRVLLNLVLNARDAIGGRGTIELSSYPETSGNAATASGVTPWVVMQIRDDGCGMDEREQQRMFDLFYTTKRSGMGSGIGLSVVKNFASESGGEIEVASQRGSGTTIRLKLPAAPAADVSTTGPSEAARDSREAAASLVVLVVEDNPVVLASAVKILKAAHFEVLEAADGQRALELVLDSEIVIDVLCIDGIIPGVGSHEVIQATRTHRPATRIVVCSGYVEEELIRRGIRTYELAFVQKPFSAASLLGGIHEALSGDAG